MFNGKSLPHFLFGENVSHYTNAKRKTWVAFHLHYRFIYFSLNFSQIRFATKHKRQEKNCNWSTFPFQFHFSHVLYSSSSSGDQIIICWMWACMCVWVCEHNSLPYTTRKTWFSKFSLHFLTAFNVYFSRILSLFFHNFGTTQESLKFLKYIRTQQQRIVETTARPSTIVHQLLSLKRPEMCEMYTVFGGGCMCAVPSRAEENLSFSFGFFLCVFDVHVARTQGSTEVHAYKHGEGGEKPILESFLTYKTGLSSILKFLNFQVSLAGMRTRWSFRIFKNLTLRIKN